MIAPKISKRIRPSLWPFCSEASPTLSHNQIILALCPVADTIPQPASCKVHVPKCKCLQLIARHNAQFPWWQQLCLKCMGLSWPLVAWLGLAGGKKTWGGQDLSVPHVWPGPSASQFWVHSSAKLWIVNLWLRTQNEAFLSLLLHHGTREPEAGTFLSTTLSPASAPYLGPQSLVITQRWEYSQFDFKYLKKALLHIMRWAWHLPVAITTRLLCNWHFSC